MAQANTARVGRTNSLKVVGGGTTTDLVAKAKVEDVLNGTNFEIGKYFDTQARETAKRAYRSTTTISPAFPAVLVEAILKESEELASTFNAQLERWETDTEFVSSLQEIVLHPSYQRIIGLGPRVVPLILRELEENSGQWFWALQALTGENPVPEEDIGRTKRMAAAWLAWGKERQYI